MRNNIKKVREQKGVNQKQLAEMIETYPQHMSRLEANIDTVDFEWLNKIAKALKVSPFELIADEDECYQIIKTENSPPENLKEFKAEQYVAIPLLDMSAAAGGGYEISEFAEFIKPLIFEIPYLRKLGNIQESFGMFVFGDSMDPVLPNGAMIIVDKSQCHIWPGKIYLVRMRTALFVKYIDVLPNKLVLRSENPKYAPIEINLEDRVDCEILGRVIWISFES